VSPQGQKVPAGRMRRNKTHATALEQITKQVEKHGQHGQCKEALILLAQLKDPIDHFFDEVMVMTDDEKLKHNRLILLSNLRQLFLKIADVSLLQT
jgi:glycyl-tRNA synthetase beta chain